MRARTRLLALAITLVAATPLPSQVKGTHADTDITVTELKAVKEYKVRGAVRPYGPGPFVAKDAHELMVVTFEAAKDIQMGDDGVKVALVDANGQAYPKLFSQTFAYEKGNVKVVALFEFPSESV